MRILYLFAGLVAACPALAVAQEAPAPAAPATPPVYSNVAGPSLKLSVALAQAALDACQARGFAVSASVVDSAGRVKVTLRADNAPKPPVAASLKAAAAAAFDAPGSEMEPRTKTDPAFAALMEAHKDQYNPHAGSLPLHKDGKVFGALAVADTGHEDADACARAARDSVAPDLK